MALEQEVRLVDLERLEPGSIVLDEIEQESCYFSSILVGVRGRFAVGEVATFGHRLFFEVYSNPKKKVCIKKKQTINLL